jgi:hypothetical protein
MKLRELEERFVARAAPLVTPERAALWSNVFVVTVIALGVARFFMNRNALADGDVGGDFRGFYHAGDLVRAGQSAHLYDRLDEIMRGGRVETPFMHPPIVAALFAPLAMLPYAVALAVFSALSIALWFWACAILARELRGASAARELGMVLRFAPVAYSLAYGQMTALLAVPLAAFVVSLRRERDVLAGACLGVLAIKPQMIAGLAVYLLVQRRFRALLSAAGASALVSLSSFALFPAAARHYAERSAQMFAWSRTPSARPWAQIGFFRLGSGTFDQIAPLLGTIMGVAFALVALAWLVSLSRKRAESRVESDVVLAAIVPLSLCLSPYLFHYDAGLFFVSFALAEHALRRASARVNVAFFATGLLLALGPGLSEHAQNLVGLSFGMQPAMLAIVYAIWALSRAKLTP